MSSHPVRRRSGPHTTPSANVNLYCTQCEAQLGIFENEWIRLTSSYARSKAKGTHFGTEVGVKTQRVPSGPAQRSAEGCEMAEVFCKKCSNMVGQYCKMAPDAEKQALVDQYFYKLSRTFLKDSRTNEKVYPAYEYDSDLPAPPASQSRSSFTPRSTVTPARWTHTPLRQSSSTPSVAQSIAKRNIRQGTIVTPEPRRNETIEEMLAGPESVEEELQSQDAVLREHANKMLHQQTQLSQHEGQLLDHDTAMALQDSTLNAQAKQLAVYRQLMSNQTQALDDQAEQLLYVTTQVATLQKSMNELRAAMQQLQSRQLIPDPSISVHVDLMGDSEETGQAIDRPQSSSEQLQALRRENEKLKSRLSSTVNGMGAVAAEEVHQTQVLGKRKRPHARSTAKPPSLADSPCLESRLARPNDRHGLARMPTPRSSNDEQSPPQLTITAKSTRASYRKTVDAASKTRHEPPRNGSSNADPMTRDHDETGARPPSGDITTSDHRSNQEALDVGSPVGARLTTTIPSQNIDKPIHPETIALSSQGPSLALNRQDLQSHNSTNLDLETDMVDAVEFSDEDGVDIPMRGDDDNNQQPDTTTGPQRDMRSMAPEPGKSRSKPKTPSTTPLTLDRVRITTPLSYWSDLTSGRELQSMRPPPKNTRADDLKEELIYLGLSHWIDKRKNTKEYRAAVTEARARQRHARKEALIQSKGLYPNLPHTSATFPEPGPLPSTPAPQAISLDPTPRSPLGDTGKKTTTANDAAAAADETQTLIEDHDHMQIEADLETTEADHAEVQPAMTRAQARRSSASLTEIIDNPELELRSQVAAHTKSVRTRMSLDISPDATKEHQGLDTRSRSNSVPMTSAVLEDAQSIVEDLEQQEPAGEAQVDHEPAAKRGRGRPRKSAPAAMLMPEDTRELSEGHEEHDHTWDGAMEHQPSVRRGRGRPRKSAPATMSSLASDKSTTPQPEVNGDVDTGSPKASTIDDVATVTQVVVLPNAVNSALQTATDLIDGHVDEQQALKQVQAAAILERERLAQEAMEREEMMDASHL